MVAAARIMQVDDDPDVLEVVRLSLRPDPEMAVFSYASGVEAVKAYPQLQPDLVLLDVKMPNMDGPTTLAMLQREHPGAAIPVVFMTAPAPKRDLDVFRSLGAAGVLAKPFDPGTLAATLRTFLEPDARDLTVARSEFLKRIIRDADELTACRTAMATNRRAGACRRAGQLAHGLAGAAGMFGYGLIGDEASALEETLIAKEPSAEVRRAIDTLLMRIADAVGEAPRIRARRGSRDGRAACLSRIGPAGPKARIRIPENNPGLPSWNGTSMLVSGSNSNVSPTVSERHCCVIVDDDPDIRNLIGHVLSRIGVRSLAATTAEALASSLTVQPAIIFLDVGLGEWDAVDGIRLLGERRYKGAVQLISGHEPALLNEIRSLGQRYSLEMRPPLRKPFLAEDLIRAVRSNGQLGTSISIARTDNPLQPVSTPAAPVQISLAEAIERRWLDTLYQPKVDLCDNRIIGAEALARVRHPEHGVLAPAAFLPGASGDDLERLTEFVLLKAFRDWEALARAGCNIRLAVNAPVAALTGSRLLTAIRECRPNAAGWPGLIIEITEGDAVEDTGLTNEVAVQLQIYKIDLSIDDFGTGYSSFARLKQFPFRELKLDRSYVRNCATDPMNRGICKSVIDLAHASDALAVAEGVECADDLHGLREMGCDLAQGYFLGAPMSLGDVIQMNARSALNPPR